MKKNTVILLLIFAVLGAAATYFLKNKNQKTTIVSPDQDFAVPAENIGKIFLADKQNHHVTIERQGDKWIVNGKYNVKKDVITNCLQAISNVKVKYVPSDNVTSGVVSEIATHGIKVEVYGKSGENLKTYYIGNNDNEGSGTYYIMQNAEKPYVVHLTSAYGELQPRFPLMEDDWRDRTVFAAEIEDIASASVEYPTQKSASFRVDKQDNAFEVAPFYTGIPKRTNAIKGKAETFLYGFKSIVAEAIENNNVLRDSFIQLQPFSVISLKSSKGEETAVRLYPIFAKDNDGKTIIGLKPDRYFAYSNKGDFYLVQDVVFRKLFWEYNSFFK
jgi:Domain of unknown function (DUF4340)